MSGRLFLVLGGCQPDTASSTWWGSGRVATVYPLFDCKNVSPSSKKKLRSRRVFSESNKKVLSLVLNHISWLPLFDADCIDDKVDMFNFLVQLCLDQD